MNINSYTLLPAQSTVELTLYTDKQGKAICERVYSEECPELWQQHPELNGVKCLFFSLTNPSVCKGTKKYTVQIDLNVQRRIAKHIISQQLYNHFRQSQIVTFDKIDNVEVWVKAQQQNTLNATEYLRFSLIPHYALFTEDWELIVSFNGVSLVYTKPLSQLDLHTSNYSVVVGGEVVKYTRLSPEQKQQIESAYPKINRALAAELHIVEKRRRNPDKYATTYNHITNFVREYLLTQEFQSLFSTSGEMLNVPEERISKVSKDANLLQFKEGNTGIDPYGCVFGSRATKPFGIFQPTTKPNVRFFFIVQESDVTENARKEGKSACQKLYDIFTRGYKPFVDSVTGEQKYYFPPLSTCIKQMFNVDRNGSITFSSPENALSEIKKKLADKKFESETHYVAIYISPISRDEVNSPYHNLYYQIKELLLEMKITSQVIYKDRPFNSSFGYHLPNIATALLAKIGGIPWQLSGNSNSKDLVVGVGAFRSEKVGVRYVGSAFCFNPNGLFQNFDCCRDNDIERIVAGIRRAIGHFLVDNNDTPERLIIHYYKTMSQREARPITQMLNTLGFNIPILIVTINKTETSDIVMFDEQQQGLMPYSGTILQIHNNDFLLFNNSRYSANEKCDMLFPVRIRLSKISNKVRCEVSASEANELLNQVYQFSRMYWKSVKQQNLPITIKYPEMVAEIVPHFTEAELPPFGKNNLWFL